MRRIFVGIDPGLDGAVAAIDIDQKVICLEDTPVIEIRRGRGHKREYQDVLMADVITRLRCVHDVVAVALEDVHAMPQQGVVSTFNFGVGKGLWRGIIAANKLPLILVAPQTWKREMLGGGGSKTDKGISLRQAMRLCPRASAQLARKRDEGRAEALLMAMWLRRRYSGGHWGPPLQLKKPSTKAG